MAFVFSVKKIHCPNCDYEGKAKLKSTGGLGWLLFLLILIVGFFFWPFLLLAIVVLIALIFKPAAQICPKCKWQHPVPIDQWQLKHSSEKSI